MVKEADEVMRHRKENDTRIQNQLEEAERKRKGPLGGNAMNSYNSRKALDPQYMQAAKGNALVKFDEGSNVVLDLKPDDKARITKKTGPDDYTEMEFEVVKEKGKKSRLGGHKTGSTMAGMNRSK